MSQLAASKGNDVACFFETLADSIRHMKFSDFKSMATTIAALLRSIPSVAPLVESSSAYGVLRQLMAPGYVDLFNQDCYQTFAKAVSSLCGELRTAVSDIAADYCEVVLFGCCEWGRMPVDVSPTVELSRLVDSLRQVWASEPMEFVKKSLGKHNKRRLQIHKMASDDALFSAMVDALSGAPAGSTLEIRSGSFHETAHLPPRVAASIVQACSSSMLIPLVVQCCLAQETAIPELAMKFCVGDIINSRVPHFEIKDQLSKDTFVTTFSCGKFAFERGREICGNS
jgi:hypothetical protein